MRFSSDKMMLAMANACMTISELATQSSLSRVTLTKFANGKSNPKPATIGKIAKALGCKVEDLINQ